MYLCTYIQQEDSFGNRSITLSLSLFIATYTQRWRTKSVQGKCVFSHLCRTHGYLYTRIHGRLNALAHISVPRTARLYTTLCPLPCPLPPPCPTEPSGIVAGSLPLVARGGLLCGASYSPLYISNLFCFGKPKRAPERLLCFFQDASQTRGQCCGSSRGYVHTFSYL